MGEFNKLYDMIQQDLAMELSINSIDEIDNAIEEYEEELF